MEDTGLKKSTKQEGLKDGTTDKQNREFQDEFYQRILGVSETKAMA